MKTSAKVFLGIGGLLVGQAIGSGLINSSGDRMIAKYNDKAMKVRDLIESKRGNELTEDEAIKYTDRANKITNDLKELIANTNDNKTMLMTVGLARLRVLKMNIKNGINSLGRIEDEINGKIINSEVVD